MANSGESRERAPMESFLGHRWGYSPSWTPADAVLFAASIGAHPSVDLDYLDLSRGPKVMPTFGAVRMAQTEGAHAGLGPWAFDPHDTFLLGCEIVTHGITPASGATAGVGEGVELWDKGNAAVIVSENRLSVDDELCTYRATIMVRGRGGFGGERGPSRIPPPDLDTAIELPVHLPDNSAVLYQLVGEHNPHSLDPEFAAQAGLPGPISAGMVLVGAAGRTLTAAFADGHHRTLTRIRVDYAGSHVTGTPLTMRARPDGTNAFDFALTSGGQPILLAGRAELT